MSRFEIEDIVAQDKRGIVFCAHDSERGHTVALRRFFPFGQDGGGLDDEESSALVIATEKLSGVTHPALRSVISGAVDPIDGIPFVVAEWIDGAPLDVVMDGGNLDPQLVIQLLRIALEVSLALSEILGEEAVWVETEVDSIFVGSEESGRGFVFWLSPFKWLGAEFGSRKLSAIVELGEQLTGWKGKRSGVHASHSLGHWLEWLRAHPDASLAEGLAALDTFPTGNEVVPSPKPTVAAPFTNRPPVKVKQPSAISPLMIAAALILLLAVAGLTIYPKITKEANIPPEYAGQENSPPPTAPKPNPQPATAETPPAVEPQPAPLAKAPQPAPKPAASNKPAPAPAIQRDEKAISAAKVNELAAKMAREAELRRTAAKATPKPAAAPPVRDFTPTDAALMKNLKAGGPANVTGVLLGVRFSSTGKSMYFDFSKPPDHTQILAVAHNRGFQGEFSDKAFADLIGKKLRFDGTVYREPNGRQYVKISSRKKITEVK